MGPRDLGEVDFLQKAWLLDKFDKEFFLHFAREIKSFGSAISRFSIRVGRETRNISGLSVWRDPVDRDRARIAQTFLA